MKLYSYEKINNEIQETYEMSFTSEKDAFAKMKELEEHFIATGYNIKAKDLSYVVAEKALSTGVIVWKKLELE